MAERVGLVSDVARGHVADKNRSINSLKVTRHEYLGRRYFDEK